MKKKDRKGDICLLFDKAEKIAAGCTNPDIIGSAEALLCDCFTIKHEIMRVDPDDRSGEGGPEDARGGIYDAP